MFSIGITTFEHRFETYFMPLVRQIKKVAPDVEIIVAINGEHNLPFSQKYRSEMLAFLSGISNTYPVFFPEFRGLAKLWNTLLIHATNNHVLVLNDDITIRNPNLVKVLQHAIGLNQGRTFYINHSWSHFLANRQEIDELGYFDERLLGIGEEDGDMSWRYLDKHGFRIPNQGIAGFVNYSDETQNQGPQNTKLRPGMKYNEFNRNFIYNQKYEYDNLGVIQGMFDTPMRLHDPFWKDQYPYERFFHEHKGNL